MIPETAECTMKTRAPAARRSAATRAMLVQLGRLETLVPPNFRMIQAEALRVTVKSSRRADSGTGGAKNRPACA